MDIRKIILEEVDDFQWIRDIKPYDMEYPPKNTFWTVHGIKDHKPEIAEALYKGGYDEGSVKNVTEQPNSDTIQVTFCNDIRYDTLSWDEYETTWEIIYDIAKREYGNCEEGVEIDSEFLVLEWIHGGFKILDRLPLQ